MWVTKQLQVPIDFVEKNKYKGFNGDQQLFGYPHSLKWLFMFNRRKKLIQD